jgi:hypothetical protein
MTGDRCLLLTAKRGERAATWSKEQQQRRRERRHKGGGGLVKQYSKWIL